MRVDLAFFVFLAASLLAGGPACSIRLDEAPPPPPATSDADTRPLGGCVPLAGAASLVTGRLDSLVLPGGAVAVLAGGATVAGTTGIFAFGAPAPDVVSSFGPCLANAVVLPAVPVVEPTAQDPGAVGRPLAGTVADGGVSGYLYFASVHADGLASDGFGVAGWDPAAGRFTAPVLLWTADRPSYGSGVGQLGGFVYVVGGLSAGFLGADMFVARAPFDRVAVAGAYEYAQGGGTWGPDPDAAAAFARGGTAPSLAFYPARGRWLLAYATPLAQEVTVRSGLGPAGPWSLPVTLGRCAIPPEDPNAFCADVVLHPLLSPVAPAPDASPLAPDAAVDIVLSYGLGSFGAPPGASVPPSAYATRLARVPWPATLP